MAPVSEILLWLPVSQQEGSHWQICPRWSAAAVVVVGLTLLVRACSVEELPTYPTVHMALHAFGGPEIWVLSEPSFAEVVI